MSNFIWAFASEIVAQSISVNRQINKIYISSKFTFSKLFVITNLASKLKNYKRLITTQYPARDCSTHRQKCQNFHKFSGVRPRSKFSNLEITKPTGDNTKIQRDGLMNTLRWLKNIYTWLTLKNRYDWVTF